MDWNIGNAKQQFSEVVRLAANEPQAIYNRDKPVAMVISAEEFEAYREWKVKQQRPTLAEQFAQIRKALIEEGAEDGIEIPPRVDRYNPLVDEPHDRGDEA
ncbi:MAG: type II toxin-antitoxin system Phd/YefM family antitoxin [Pseudomonadota bacterium]|nr:type II toxin-antitoxin system Phd/YefM family antitoxin [Pseudomonadota bacterium]